MIWKVNVEGVKVIGFLTAKINLGIGFIMFIPMAVAFLLKEWNMGFSFLFGSSLTILISVLLIILCRSDRSPSWSEGLPAVAFAWILATMLCALPYYMSGFMGSYLDACFDVMSGFTTTGLYLMKDLDHIPYSLNLWRHILTYCGGQGIVVIAFSIMSAGTTGMFKMYVGEGREERILPNVMQTARMIWIISLTYLVIGTTVLTIVELFDGLPFWKALFHGLCLFMTAWSTGGFAPNSQNIVYYHSYIVEIITLVFMILGSLNFALHYAVWNGHRKEIWRNIEIRSFSFTLAFSFLILILGLLQTKAYPDFLMNYRRGFYQIVSAHTGAGNMSIYARQFVTEWGQLGMLGICLAMSIGACACSTGGGFKSLRIGVIFKSLIQDIKKLISPESSVITQKFHHIRDNVLDNTFVKNAMMIILLYMVIYFTGTIVGMYYGYTAIEAFFESISAGANCGLTCGITSPSMPALLKFVYLMEMWLGRLEFISVLTLFGVLFNYLMPKKQRLN